MSFIVRTVVAPAIVGMWVVGAASTANGAAGPVTVLINAGHNHDLTGPVKFETEFSQLQGFFTPTVAGTTADGGFTFLPRSATSPGGMMQVRFVNLQAQFSATCEVGATGQPFEVLLSDSTNLPPQKLSIASVLQNGIAVLRFDSQPMRGVGIFDVRISSPDYPREWNLKRCVFVFADAPQKPKPPTSVGIG